MRTVTRSSPIRWAVTFVAASLGGIAAVLLVLWGLNGFHSLGIGATGTIALVLGIVFTSGLGVALMALMFYSDRSNIDEDAYRAATAIDQARERGSSGKDGDTTAS